MEGCTGWRYVAEELAAAGVAAHLGEPADTAAARGRKRHAKTDKTDSRHLRTLLAEGRLPECWIPPAHILEYRALLETYHDLRREHTAWVQRIHAVFFHQGAPPLGEGALRTEQGLAALRAAAAAHLSPAGQLQVATALDMLAAIEARMERAAHAAARCRPASDRREGAGRAAVWGRPGHRAGADLLAGRSGPVLLLPQGGPVHRAGHHRLLLRPQRTRPGGCPGRDRRCCAGRSMRPARPTPALRPPTTRYYAAVKDRKNSKRAALSEARKIVRQACHILTELGDDALTAA